LVQSVLDVGLGGGSTYFAVFIKLAFKQKFNQTMPKNAFFYWKKSCKNRLSIEGSSLIRPPPVDIQRNCWFRLKSPSLLHTPTIANVRPLEVVVSPFLPTSPIQGQGPHHHIEAARNVFFICFHTSPQDGTPSSVIHRKKELEVYHRSAC